MSDTSRMLPKPSSTERRRLLALPLALAAWSSGLAAAPEAWPSRPIKWIVLSPPGGAPDVIARELSERIVRKSRVAVAEAADL